MSVPKRLPKEIMDASTPEMRSSGIHYLHDDVNSRKGYAMIIGPEDTPYAHCALFFLFDFPADYPFSSPTVTFMTSDGVTRFHPNLYVGGKVCLSILGTWQGPKWSAVMTISTILSSIQSLLEANPIVNEPGWEKYTLEESRASDYAGLVHHNLVAHTFRNLCRWKAAQYPPEWSKFEDVMAEVGDGLFDKLFTEIRANAEKGETTYQSVVYNMRGTTCWKVLLELGEKVMANPGTSP